MQNGLNGGSKFSRRTVSGTFFTYSIKHLLQYGVKYLLQKWFKQIIV